jgi:Fe-S oxidoreductase
MAEEHKDNSERERVIEYRTRPVDRDKPVFSSPLFPHQIVQFSIVAFVLIGAVIFLAAWLPPPLHEPANEFVTPAFLLPDWFFLWIYGVLKWVGWIYSVFNINTTISILSAKVVGVLLSIGIVGLLFIVPFIDPGPTARLTTRRKKSSIGVAVIFFIVFMSVYGINEIISQEMNVGIEETRAFLGVLAVGAPTALGLITYMGLGRFQSGYEYQLNRCYQCEKCAEVCPITAIGEIQNLNLVNDTHLNITDDTWSCLTCGQCSANCPQGLNYEDYILSLRQGEPCDLVAHKDAFTDLTEIMTQVDIKQEENPQKESDYGYFSGCLEHLAAYMEVGDPFTDISNASMKLLEKADVNPIKVDLKCCGHDQLWQGKSETFESLKEYNTRKISEYGIKTLILSCAECYRTFAKNYDLDDIKVVHLSEILTKNMDKLQGEYAKNGEPILVTTHDACRLRHMDIYDEPRMLIRQVNGVELLEIDQSRENSRCCGVAGMMMCNDVRMGLITDRLEQAKETGAKYLVTTCPKCLAHFVCMKRAWSERDDKGRYDLEIMDLSVFLAHNLENGFETNQEAMTG